MTLPENLEYLMQTMDWFFDYSDDQRTWRKGHAQHTQIATLLHLVPKDDAIKLIEKYVPEELQNKYLNKDKK
jgi:predicted metal-dependent hydrolase